MVEKIKEKELKEKINNKRNYSNCFGNNNYCTFNSSWCNLINANR